MFREAFQELPYKIIWKLDADHVKINSNKILVQSWYPQRDVLGNNVIHYNIFAVSIFIFF